MSDLNHTGAGGPLTATDSIGMTVQPMTTRQSSTVPGAQSIPEDTDRAISGISVADIDAGAAPSK